MWFLIHCPFTLFHFYCKLGVCTYMMCFQHLSSMTGEIGHHISTVHHKYTLRISSKLLDFYHNIAIYMIYTVCDVCDNKGASLEAVLQVGMMHISHDSKVFDYKKAEQMQRFLCFTLTYSINGQSFKILKMPDSSYKYSNLMGSLT